MKTNYYYHTPFKENLLLKVPAEKVSFKMNKSIWLDDIKSLKRIKLPRMTVMGVFNSETECFTITTAFCHVDDKFVRKEGRKICHEKYLNNEFKGLYPVPTEQMSTPGKYFCRVAEVLVNQRFKHY